LEKKEALIMMNQAVDSKKAKNVLHIYTFSIERLERPKKTWPKSQSLREIMGRAGMGWLVRTGQFSSSDGCLRDCALVVLIFIMWRNGALSFIICCYQRLLLYLAVKRVNYHPGACPSETACLQPKSVESVCWKLKTAARTNYQRGAATAKIQSGSTNEQRYSISTACFRHDGLFQLQHGQPRHASFDF
jgi:hypothetical protein